MSIEAGFDVSELNDLTKELIDLAEKQYPKEAKAFLRQEAGDTRNLLKSNTTLTTNRKTGNLLKGIDRGAPHTYQGDHQIRVYNKAPHAHLLEHGHRLVIKKTDTGKRTEGKFMAAFTTRRMKQQMAEDVEKFIDDLLEKGLG